MINTRLLAIVIAFTAGIIVARSTGLAHGAAGDDAVDSGLPGPHHAKLEALAGKWKYTVTSWSAPGAEPGTFELDVDYRWVLGGRYLIGAYRGFAGGEYYEARDVVGYDNVAGQYIATWLDNESTSFTIGNGLFDDAARTLTIKGEEAGSRGGLSPYSVAYTFQDADRLAVEIKRTAADGTMYTSASVEATRE